MSEKMTGHARRPVSRRGFLQGSAAYSGKVVTWEDALNQGRQLTTDAETWDGPAPVQPKPDGGYEIPLPGVTKVI